MSGYVREIECACERGRQKVYMKLCAVDEVDTRKTKSDKLNTSVMDIVLLVIKIIFLDHYFQ